MIATIVAMFVMPLVSPYLNKSNETSKSLTAYFSGPLDPLKDLTDGQVKIDFELRREGEVIPRVYIYRASLENTGSIPILPVDFYSSLGVTTQDPWKIVAVGSKSAKLGPQEIALTWSRVSDLEFSAAPELVNPGDSIDVNVYLTAPREEIEKLKYDSPAPIKWKVRVANLASITTEASPVTKALNQVGPIQVYIWGWGIPIIVILFAALLTVHYSLLNMLAPIRKSIDLPLRIASAVLCLSTAEALTTYVFGSHPLYYLVDHWANIPPLVLNFVFMLTIFVFGYRRSGPTSSTGADAVVEGD